MSVLIKPHGGLSTTDSLPLIAALGVAKTLVRWNVRAAVRWPNDVVVDGRKIAGVLVESKSKGNELTYAAVGIGINANVDTGAINSIRDSSTSLLALLGEPVNREELIVTVLSDLESTYESIQDAGESDGLDILADLDGSRGKHVTVRTVNRDLVGLFDSYESLSRVRIRTRSGLERVDTNAVVSVYYESDQSKPATG
jgi:BirA family biotin operon repressor/biotin-[acetyl-CoA-carboxylase] ligase